MKKMISLLVLVITSMNLFAADGSNSPIFRIIELVEHLLEDYSEEAEEDDERNDFENQIEQEHNEETSENEIDDSEETDKNDERFDFENQIEQEYKEEDSEGSTDKKYDEFFESFYLILRKLEKETEISTHNAENIQPYINELIKYLDDFKNDFQRYQVELKTLKIELLDLDSIDPSGDNIIYLHIKSILDKSGHLLDNY